MRGNLNKCRAFAYAHYIVRRAEDMCTDPVIDARGAGCVNQGLRNIQSPSIAPEYAKIITLSSVRSLLRSVFLFPFRFRSVIGHRIPAAVSVCVCLFVCAVCVCRVQCAYISELQTFDVFPFRCFYTFSSSRIQMC